ncbi:MAG TPA: energy-coupling factor transporter transmembrane component T [Candidatus Limnocylindria bacterium]|nr:energy-coupling factor transporter transmembrane component T [Candidatus Limnocylindria bacterium]
MTAAMLAPEIGPAQRESLLGRTNPLVKLGIALVWLLGLGLTIDVRPPLILTLVALVAGIQLGSLSPAVLARRLALLSLAALSIALTNLLFSTHNPDPLATELFRAGPLRVTLEAVEAAAGIGARVVSIISVGAVFALTTDATRLVDSLVQLARVSPRFAYGLLAAYQAVPRLANDLGTLRGARRLRGLREWHPRLLVGLLVRAIRHADQLAIAMDARGFGSGPRTTYRPVRWTLLDAVAAAAAFVILVAALVLAG